MTIEVKAPNGAVVAFPDGTPHDVIAKAMGEFSEPTPDVSKLESGIRGGVQGLTFGLSDEGYGVYRGLKDWITGSGEFGAGYAKGRDEERKANEDARKANPKTYLAGEIGSAVAVPGGLAKLGLKAAGDTAKLSLGARSLAAAKEGAAYGAAYGFGKGEGLEGSAVNALKDAAIGAPLGAVLPAAVDTARAIASKATTPFRAVANPQAVGNEKFAEALMRDTPEGISMRRPGALLERFGDRLDRARSTTPEVMMADVGGENTRNLLRTAANMPTAGAEQLRKKLDFRQSNQWRRLERGLEDTLANPSEYASGIDAIVVMREAAADPAFKAAFNVRIKPTDELVEVLQRPGMKSILDRVSNKMANEGKPVAGEPPMKLLHRAKMEIDTAIGEVKRGQAPTAGWDVGTLRTMKRDLVNAIDNPLYKDALKNFAGSSALKNAAEDGFENALKMPTEEIRKTLNMLGSDSEREMWRLGASRALAGKIRQGNVMRDRTESIFGSPDMQLRMQEIFPNNEKRRQFQRALIIEAKMADTRKAVQGNSTTAKQLAQGDEAGQALRPAAAIANSAVTGRLEPVLNYLSRQAQRFNGLTPSTADAIIKAAMMKNSGITERAWLDAVRKAEKEPEFRAELVRRLIAGGAAAPNAPAQ